MAKKKKQSVKGQSSSSKHLEGSDQPDFCISFTYKINVYIHNLTYSFDPEPKDFELSEVSGCFGKKKKMNRRGRKWIKEYNLNPCDCEKPGIGMKLAFQFVANQCKNEPIQQLSFSGMVVTPDDMTEWQQQQIDHGVPDNFFVRHLRINIPEGIHPRVHERLNYDHLYFNQQYCKEEQRIYHVVNEKMLKTQSLIISCFISNPEVLSQFEGWGLIVDYAQENKINKSFIEDVIDDWISGKVIRKLTGLYDQQFYFNESGRSVSPGSIMSIEDKDAIVEKLSNASQSFEQRETQYSTKRFTRFTRKDGAQADLHIAMGDFSNCIGMKFIQPPDDDIIKLHGYTYC